MKKKYFSKNNKCIDCNKQITNKAKRCHKCASFGTLNGYYKKGKLICKICGKILKDYRSKLCLPCNAKYNNHNRKTISIKYCIDCKKILSRYSRSKRCRVCFLRGKNNPRFGKSPNHGKGSYYKNNYMRSTWEIAYAKYLDNNNIKWQYEPKPFKITYNYKGIEKEGTYTPDFYLPGTNEYIEIKGWWRDDAQTKFNAFKSQYPTTKLILLMEKELKLLKVLT